MTELLHFYGIEYHYFLFFFKFTKKLPIRFRIYKKLFKFALILTKAVIAQLVEHQLPKLRVTSSSLAYRS